MTNNRRLDEKQTPLEKRGQRRGQQHGADGLAPGRAERARQQHADPYDQKGGGNQKSYPTETLEEQVGAVGAHQANPIVNGSGRGRGVEGRVSGPVGYQAKQGQQSCDAQKETKEFREAMRV